MQAAKNWIPKYKGKHLAKGYSKHFGVDKLCAVKELEMLGYPIQYSYKKQLRETMNHHHRAAAEKQAEAANDYEESNEKHLHILLDIPQAVPRMV